MQLYQNRSSYPKVNAQENLCGRTHYVDPATLRFHKSKVLSSHVTDGGLLFAIITSDAVDYNNTKRGFRFAVFDVFGTVVQRTKLEDAFRRSEQASKAMWAFLNSFSATAHTRQAIEDARSAYSRECDELAKTVERIASEQKAA